MRYVMLCVIGLSLLNVDDTLGCELENYQKEILQFAYDYGNAINYLNQGWGETIASIVYQESKAGYKLYERHGVIVGDRDSRGRYKSLGVMQVQLPAARDTLRWFPSISKEHFGDYPPTDEELIYKLLSNYKFNIQIGSLYFIKMLQLTNQWRAAILAYNAGLNNKGRDTNDYVRKVLNWRNTVLRECIR